MSLRAFLRRLFDRYSFVRLKRHGSARACGDFGMGRMGSRRANYVIAALLTLALRRVGLPPEQSALLARLSARHH